MSDEEKITVVRGVNDIFEKDIKISDFFIPEGTCSPFKFIDKNDYWEVVIETLQERLFDFEDLGSVVHHNTKDILTCYVGEQFKIETYPFAEGYYGGRMEIYRGGMPEIIYFDRGINVLASIAEKIGFPLQRRGFCRMMLNLRHDIVEGQKLQSQCFTPHTSLLYTFNVNADYGGIVSLAMTMDSHVNEMKIESFRTPYMDLKKFGDSAVLITLDLGKNSHSSKETPLNTQKTGYEPLN